MSQKLSPMLRVVLPALYLRAAYWAAMEDALRTQQACVAADRQAAPQTKEVAL